MRLGRKFYDKLRTGLENPELVIRKCNRMFQNYIRKSNNFFFALQHEIGINVMEEDWDNLIILDACRFDSFVECSNIDGDLSSVISAGGNSRLFMESNFYQENLHDTVYVTANLHAEFLNQDDFYTVEVIPYSERNPKRVVDAAIQYFNEYNDKRLIVHFMQPHKPHLGPTGDLVREKLKNEGNDHLITRGNFVSWEAYKQDIISHRLLRKAYLENLEIALNHTEKLLSEICGKTVITSDHGELLGESLNSFTERLYGHPGNVMLLELYKVPWLTIESDHRRNIREEEPIGFERLNSEIAERRLKELGYAQ